MVHQASAISPVCSPQISSGPTRTNRTKHCSPITASFSPAHLLVILLLFLFLLLLVILLHVLLLLSSCPSPSPPALEQLSLHTHSHQNQLWRPNPSTQQPPTQSEPRLSPGALLLILCSPCPHSPSRLQRKVPAGWRWTLLASLAQGLMGAAFLGLP